MNSGAYYSIDTGNSDTVFACVPIILIPFIHIAVKWIEDETIQFETEEERQYAIEAMHHLEAQIIASLMDMQ